MGLTRLSVYRPIVVLVALVAIIMFGLVSFLRLGLDQLPEIKIPVVTVLVPFPGAGPKEVEEQLTRKVEDALASLSDVAEIRSVSSQGLATISVEFRESVNIDLAALDVERTVNNLRRELPAEVESATVRKIDLNDQPILYLALTTTVRVDPTEMYRLADDRIRPRIEALEGIASARVLGGRKPEIQVAVDPERLRAFRLSVADVSQALSNQYQTISGGIVRGGLSDPNREFSLRVEGRDRDPAQLGSLTVTGRDGTTTELRNVADVSSPGADQVAIVRLNGRDAVGLLVSKQSSANITQAADRVLDEIAAINPDLPAGMQLETIIDRSAFIRLSVKDVEKELSIAILITGLVLLLFLHTLRATIIVLIAIPTCIVATFIAMILVGQTINILSLLGLTTSIGILVDDSIVVLENIYRKLEHGMEPKTAAVEGRSEIGLAAIAITLVDVVVFGPIIFLTGTTGGFFRAFAVVIASTTLLSLLVSFTITPLLASRWLKVGQERGWLARATGSWEPLYRFLERRYGRFLAWSLRHRLLVIGGALSILVGSFWMVRYIGAEFVPDIDSPFIALAGELPGGTSIEATDRAARLWEQRLLDRSVFPEVKKVYMVVGAGSTDLDRGTRYLSLILDIGQRQERTRRSSELQRLVLAAAEGVPELSTSVGGNRPGGVGQAIAIRLFGRDIDELSRTAEQVRARLAARPELADVTNSTGATSPEVIARVDQKRAQDLGLSTQQIGAAVRIAYQGFVPAKWPRPDGSEVDIRVRLPESVRRDLDALQDLPLVTSRGAQVTLGQVADLERQRIPARINRIQRQRVALVGADPLGVPLGAATQIVTEELGGMALPPSVRWELAGQSRDQQEAFTNLAIALGISVVLVYLVLTALYESLVIPFVIVLSLPLALIGALAGLLILKNTLNVLSMIGVIALFGLVGKNAILLVDYVKILRERGMERNAAILEAGPIRLRPILMTSSTLVLGLLPVALFPGEGGELRSPVAAVLVGGMISSTVLTLVFVPVVYTYFDGFERWLHAPSLPRFGRQRAVASLGGASPNVSIAAPSANGTARAPLGASPEAPAAARPRD